MLDSAYRNARHRVTALVATLDDDRLQTTVPATPLWTVHDLLAHLVGGAADNACGRIEGAASDEWTARHVAERQRDSVEALLTEWERDGPVVESGLAGVRFTGPNLAADLICHEADLREALDLPPVDRAHWHEPFLDVMMRVLATRLKPITSVLVHDEEGNEWLCGTAEPTSRLRADGYELLRAMSSRRSRRQIAAWDWSSTPDVRIVDSFGLFGPRDDDQPIPRHSSDAHTLDE